MNHGCKLSPKLQLIARSAQGRCLSPETAHTAFINKHLLSSPPDASYPAKLWKKMPCLRSWFTRGLHSTRWQRHHPEQQFTSMPGQVVRAVPIHGLVLPAKHAPIKSARLWDACTWVCKRTFRGKILLSRKSNITDSNKESRKMSFQFRRRVDQHWRSTGSLAELLLSITTSVVHGIFHCAKPWL